MSLLSSLLYCLPNGTHLTGLNRHLQWSSAAQPFGSRAPSLRGERRVETQHLSDTTDGSRSCDARYTHEFQARKPVPHTTRSGEARAQEGSDSGRPAGRGLRASPRSGLPADRALGRRGRAHRSRDARRCGVSAPTGRSQKSRLLRNVDGSSDFASCKRANLIGRPTRGTSVTAEQVRHALVLGAASGLTASISAWAVLLAGGAR